MERNPVMVPATPPGGRRSRTYEPSPRTVAAVVEPSSKPNRAHADTATLRAADTIAIGTYGACGLAADIRSGTMTRTELLRVVKAFRDERGRRHDTAAHLLLTEVACHLEWDSSAARDQLLSRVKALRDERLQSQDTLLLVLLGEIALALDHAAQPVPSPTRGYCEFCGTEDGGCAVCGGA
jgi:hypothetical protein